jgi:flagellar hook-associated protein FlgK
MSALKFLENVLPRLRDSGHVTVIDDFYDAVIEVAERAADVPNRDKVNIL